MDKTLHIVDRIFDLFQNLGKPLIYGIFFLLTVKELSGKETFAHLFFDFDIGFNLNSI